MHEADIAAHGTEGTGLTWIEHHHPRSRQPKRANQYTNCFYSCRFCNAARSDARVKDRRGRRLLDPCSVAWSAHFKLRGTSLHPLDDDARYTHEIYDLDDPRKVQMRANRREVLTEALRVLREVPDLVDQLLVKSSRVGTQRRMTLVAAAENLEAMLMRARDDLEHFRVIPRDADPECACTTGACELPDFAFDIFDLPERGKTR